MVTFTLDVITVGGNTYVMPSYIAVNLDLLSVNINAAVGLLVGHSELQNGLLLWNIINLFFRKQKRLPSRAFVANRPSGATSPKA
jgi:hypothetical protein